MKFLAAIARWESLSVLLLIAMQFRVEGQGHNAPAIPQQILPHVYLLKGNCNAYLLVSGEDGLFIDNTTTDIALLKKVTGVKRIDWVLHTHYHRDQCTGDAKLKYGKTSIAIGSEERDFLAPEVLFSRLNQYAPLITPVVDSVLHTNEVFTWKNYSIRVLGTPGHTSGSLSFAVEVDGKRLLFTGDLIMKGGYIHDLYGMQWQYLENPGIDSSLKSLVHIGSLQPDLLLPSHGELIRDPVGDMNRLVSRLKQFDTLFTFERTPRWNWSGFVQISPHLIQDCGTTTQILIAKNGHALLFDCGTDFTPERLETAKRMFGFNRVDVIIPSHWHADHTGGINALLAHENAAVWAYEPLAAYLEFPWRFPATCFSDISIKADRILRKGERFEWEGDTFTVWENPVHMDQQMALGVQADGLRFLLMADGSACSRHGHIRSAIHCYNGITLKSCLIATANTLREADPYIVVPAHSNAFALSEGTRDEYMDWAVRATKAIRDLLRPELQEMYFNPYWATFYPSRSLISRSGPLKMTLRIRNDGPEIISGTAYIHTYTGVIAEKGEIAFSVSSGGSAEYAIAVSLVGNASPGKYMVSADLECNGAYFSEYALGYLEYGSITSEELK